MTHACVWHYHVFQETTNYVNKCSHFNHVVMLNIEAGPPRQSRHMRLLTNFCANCRLQEMRTGHVFRSHLTQMLKRKKNLVSNVRWPREIKHKIQNFSSDRQKQSWQRKFLESQTYWLEGYLQPFSFISNTSI